MSGNCQSPQNPSRHPLSPDRRAKKVICISGRREFGRRPCMADMPHRKMSRFVKPAARVGCWQMCRLVDWKYQRDASREIRLLHAASASLGTIHQSYAVTSGRVRLCKSRVCSDDVVGINSALCDSWLPSVSERTSARNLFCNHSAHARLCRENCQQNSALRRQGFWRSHRVARAQRTRRILKCSEFIGSWRNVTLGSG